MQRHKILFIDAYDSFSNSIIALLRAELSVAVDCIKIDDPRFVLNDEVFYSHLDGYDAVAAGPGPGHPANAGDIGLIGKLWDLPHEHLLPVLGICLGFQSLCLAYGGNVVKLLEPRHGIMAIVEHCGDDIFSNTGKIVATQYHSLHVQLETGHTSGRDSPESDGDPEDHAWKPSQRCPHLKPLAWNLLNVNNGPILMAVRHCDKPFWAVQYHPESICTNQEGQKLVANWWSEACRWRKWGRLSDVQRVDDAAEDVDVGKPTVDVEAESVSGRTVTWRTAEGDLPDVAAIVESFRDSTNTGEPLLLESGLRNNQPINSKTGHTSIIGLPGVKSNQIRYFTNRRILEVIEDDTIISSRPTTIDEVFLYIDEYMRERRMVEGPAKSTFWGGLIGYVSYEAGLETIEVRPCDVNPSRPDLLFTFVERSIVIDHTTGIAYIQSIRPDDTEWVQEARSQLQNLAAKPNPPQHLPADLVSANLSTGPAQDIYINQVKACQAELRAGESYELCLTDQSTLQTPADPWSLYCKLRLKNPAPFSSYLHISSPNASGLSIASTSPERFLSWSRRGQCQFRPIKGTVKKGPDMTRKKAEEILGSAKERAENLMIVDLIRHDLAGVIGENQVRVPKLMSVEEYETVYQLVSVIEGNLGTNASGASVLAASLPPGSMTGAPKKRSCELLQKIERGQPRSLYSGVIGYFDVGGGGDFSVVIRTAFKWDDDADWRVGAGGAITVLSEPEAEWEEMLTKRESVLQSLNS
ncbi:Aminodeoxychorismate synthase [Fulvia fulva]|uniref:aminodeoxychorismate synthase n=1 Tax=Passalora fulva TaxID=5499 RepID=A0A9Q8L9Q4_PASFU|nr:Aminodeoxychorismate synthase [Fulvia fulva]KAK4632419.1 Aminodeoxychorismate synthase [Fulvia fulva]KAK4632832.1 Aminodeoxychorismate synthase [Fulvia fulva]UJO13299.1 Aminodeoxychorismate synthase [Fulvia fulva]WPV11084.1 Aminodeoxychorismate synthase [Fulvia fulva]WPV26860.1 Aminodeoxychorismate synthase [Fulvia fulva]